MRSALLFCVSSVLQEQFEFRLAGNCPHRLDTRLHHIVAAQTIKHATICSSSIVVVQCHEDKERSKAARQEPALLS